MKALCVVFGCKEVVIDLKEDTSLQIISWPVDSVIPLIETRQCLRCHDTREVKSRGRRV